MSEAVKTVDFSMLTVRERLELMDAIWDSIPNRDETFELTEEEKCELDRRVADCKANPENGVTWEEARNRLRTRRKSMRA